MDQDSLFYKDSFANYLSQIKQHPELIKNGSTFCPCIVDRANNNGDFTPKSDIFPLSRAITSGTIYNLTTLKQIGGFREDYKIDYVDFEMSVRLNLNNYKIYRCHQGILMQQYGDTKKLKKHYVLNYSPNRLYFQTRNRQIFRKEYPTTSGTAPNFKVNIRLIPKILLFETNKLNKITAILKGWIDGARYKTYNHEQNN